ncbi:hypothetical protein DAPPUDRAFT_248773 [Daphnia pulex]|uniref:Uncharacterized protein n=1 Tax=Daphnia pulex TaxID=6669 RepID=E9GV65_DAPPU|nr:hypothetical protein DAPPUDRAFT_248773 [Daphnia pulex]|eukprot:EFX76606.1 hypothetical protein DAPPUDRAFT_248773 [Daphnia pulex]
MTSTMLSLSLNSVAAILLVLLAGFPVNNGDDTDAAVVTTPSPDVGPWVLVTNPLKLERITEMIPYTINLTLTYSESEEPPKYVSKETLFVVKVSTTNPLTVKLDSKEIVFTWEDVTEGNNKSLGVTGQVIGYVDLNFVLDILPKNGSVAVETVPVLSGYLVTVIRESDTLDNVFTIIMIIMAVLNTINMGCALDMAIVKQNILRPVGPIVGFISQFTFMPLFAFGIAMLMIKDPLMGFGLLVIGVCPGGIASNFWTLLLDGDVNLSITMTFVSSIAAMGMMPLWLWLLSPFFLPPGSSVQVPFLDMAVSLILLTVPLGIGLLIRRFKLSVAEFLTVKIIKPFSFFFIFFIFGLGFYSMSHIFILLDWTLLTAGLAVTVAGFVFGAFFAWITRLGRPQIIAVSLETAMQNANIAFVLLKTTLPTPYSDIAALPAIAQILMTTSILFIFFGIIMAYRCVKNRGCKKKEDKVEEEEETTKSLMLKDYTDGSNGNAKKVETPPPQYYGGQVTPEFSWAKRPSLIVPSSPTIDPRIIA